MDSTRLQPIEDNQSHLVKDPRLTSRIQPQPRDPLFEPLQSFSKQISEGVRIRNAQISTEKQLECINKDLQKAQGILPKYPSLDSYLRNRQRQQKEEQKRINKQLEDFSQAHNETLHSLTTKIHSNINLEDIKRLQQELQDAKTQQEQEKKKNDEKYSTLVQENERLQRDLESSKTDIQKVLEQVDALRKTVLDLRQNDQAIVQSSVVDTVARSDNENLNSQFQSFREAQKETQGLFVQELERLNASLQKKSEVLESLQQQQTQTQVRNQNQNHIALNNQATLDKFDKLNQITDSHDVALRSHQIAIQCHEKRFNNMTSEPIVQQMVDTLQTMYPYANTAQQEITVLKGQVAKLSANTPAPPAVDVLASVQELQSDKEKFATELTTIKTDLRNMEEEKADRLATMIVDIEKLKDQFRSLHRRLPARQETPLTPSEDQAESRINKRKCNDDSTNSMPNVA
ncbi:hypothetical protein FQN57_003311 [Myotisia sp. PD_48]|nr:hypothetical protein FQN57_003311 [Myotisia sp. PD_48]